jgi:3-phenylpropionate/trans-cinnamate dioxygenase ferredoxin reductase component
VTGGPIVIVGASVAGVRAAQALRSRGNERPVVLVDAEPGLPYDKPALSKSSLTTGEQPPLLLTAEAIDELRLDHRPETVATGLDVADRVLHTSAGPVGFEDLVIATGSRPRRLTALEGPRNVHYVRTRCDALRLRAALADKPRVVVVGGGFIGGEVAASARELGLEVEIVEAAPRILARLMPARVSTAISQLHADHGVVIRCGRSVVGHSGSPALEAVALDDGTSMAAGLVVVGIGTEPATEWLDRSGLVLADGVVCGPDLQALGAPGVWVAGDAARISRPGTGATDRAEHWTSAREQAAVVARNITRADPTGRAHHRAVNYVWSDQYGVRIQHVGRVGTDLDEDTPTTGGRLFVHREGATIVGATALDAPAEILRLRRQLTAA